MKRALGIRWISGLVLTILLLTACGQSGEAKWQEQYDLGVRYLSEGNYQEAIVAFTAAIEIDPKRPEAYVGRGDTYALSGDTEDNLSAALADYEAALALDETQAAAWLGLADVYIRRGEYDKAYEVLREGLEKCGDSQEIADKIAEMESGVYTDSSNNIRRSNDYDMEGNLVAYTVYSYDFLGRRCGWENYNSFNAEGEDIGEIAMSNYCQVDFDEQNRPERYRFYNPDGTPSEYDTFTYNEEGLKSEQHRYDQSGKEICYFLFYYDDQGREIRYEGYDENGMYGYWISEYDDQGNLVRETQYDADGTQVFYSTFE